MAYIGKSVRRDEDFRFLRGRGRFVDDLKAPDALWAAFVRSPHAHARIGALDIADAAAMLGVVAVLTGADWAAEGYGEMPCLAPENFSDGRPMNEALRPVFSTQRVRHVGEPVAMVVAETRDRANDAAEAVAVEYDALAAVAHPLEALRRKRRSFTRGSAPISASMRNTETARRPTQPLPVPPMSAA